MDTNKHGIAGSLDNADALLQIGHFSLRNGVSAGIHGHVRGSYHDGFVAQQMK